MVREIPLTRGYVALVDDEDYEDLCRFTWHAMPSNGQIYAKTSMRCGSKTFQFRMHRVITAAADGMDVDHINGDGLDNRRANLRVATRSQNSANARRSKNNKSGFKGVSWDSRRSKWRAYLYVNGTVYRSCFHDSAVSAAKEYDDLARTHFGDFARLNFPIEGERAA